MKVWINRARTYKTHLIDMLRDNPDGAGVEIYATHVKDSPAMARADHSAPEPGRDTPDEEYAKWALNFADFNGIDVLIPSERMEALVQYQDEFRRIGTTLLSAPDPRTAYATDSKTETYRIARKAGLRVPLHFQVTSAVGFLDAVAALEAQDYTPCVKRDTGFAADSYRVLTRARTGVSDLFERKTRSVHVDEYARVLSEMEQAGEKVPPLIVAPVMDDPEVSVDCLTAPGGEVVCTIARTKNSYARTFTDDLLVHHIAATMAKALGITYLSNIQTRMLDGEPFLLEVNPRASDGLFHCAATGVNLPWEAIRIAQGEPVRQLRPDISKTLYVVDSVIEPERTVWRGKHQQEEQ